MASMQPLLEHMNQSQLHKLNNTTDTWRTTWNMHRIRGQQGLYSPSKRIFTWTWENNHQRLTTFDIWGLTIQECGFKIKEILYLFLSHWNSYCISVATDTWSGHRNHSFLLTIIKHEQYWNKNLQLKTLQNPKSFLLPIGAYYYQPAHVIQLVRCLTFQLILNFCVKKKKEPQWNANIGQVIIRVCLLQIALLQIWLRATASLAQPLVAYWGGRDASAAALKQQLAFLFGSCCHYIIRWICMASEKS